MSIDLVFYGELLDDLKTRIRRSQLKASLAVNAEMILLYWDIGQMIHQRQQQEGWGTGVIPRLSKDIRNELPELKGFSERNIGYMIRFAREYDGSVILQQAVANLEPVLETATKTKEKKICRNCPSVLLKGYFGSIIKSISGFHYTSTSSSPPTPPNDSSTPDSISSIPPTPLE
jgi:DUF1016 N-terminal domain